MSKKQEGFTLIELMIVITIIGILTAFALPAYQDYVARSQALEGFMATAGIRSDIITFQAENGRLPHGGDLTPMSFAGNIVKQSEELEGKYFIKRGVQVINGGIIRVTFKSGANKGKSMKINPIKNNTSDQIIRWRCRPNDRSGIDLNRLPKVCR